MIAVVLVIALSGVAKAICDVSAENGFPNQLWNKSMTWRNKWRNGDPLQGESFFGSSTFLVSLTDPWHIFDVLRDLALIVACFLAQGWIMVPIIYAVRQIIFELVYRLIKNK